MMLRALRLLRFLDQRLQRLELAGVAAALGVMLALSFADVLLRNIFHASVEAFPIVARHLVLWVGMLGASLATADRKHIAIELFAPILTPSGRRVVEGIIDVATIFVCALLAWVAWAWIGFLERPESSTLFVLPGLDLAVKRWWSLSIVPVGFALMSLRFARLALERIFVEEGVDPAGGAAREIEEYERRHPSGEASLAHAGPEGAGSEAESKGAETGPSRPARPERSEAESKGAEESAP